MYVYTCTYLCEGDGLVADGSRVFPGPGCLEPERIILGTGSCESGYVRTCVHVHVHIL